MISEAITLCRATAEGVSVGFIASIPLGPIGVLCIQRTLNNGHRSGFASGAGAATSDFLYALVAGFSISMVTDFIDAWRPVLLVVGAGVLLFLGLRMLLAKPRRHLHRTNAPVKASSLWQNYVSTFFLTVSNPLALFVFIGAFSLVGVYETLAARCLEVGGVLIGALLWWFTLTMMVGIFRKKLTIRRLFYINKIAGGVIVTLVLMTGIMELRKLFSDSDTANIETTYGAQSSGI